MFCFYHSTSPLWFILTDCHKSRAIHFAHVCCNSEMTCFTAPPAWSSIEGEVLFLSTDTYLQFLVAGFPKTVCEIRVPFSASLKGPVHSGALTTHSPSDGPACIFHFCFVWISEIAMGSGRAFAETAPSKKTGSGPLLFPAIFSLVEWCDGWRHVWKGSSRGAGVQMPYETAPATPHSYWDNIL